MRWRNVQMFGWKELKPPLYWLLVGVISIAVIVSGMWWFSNNEQIPISPEVQQVLQEGVPMMSVQENVSEAKSVEDDSEFYAVNTFFFSSDCVFQYRSFMDDLEDLQVYRATVEQAGNTIKVEQANKELSVVRANLRRLILDCI